MPWIQIYLFLFNPTRILQKKIVATFSLFLEIAYLIRGNV